MNTLAPAIITSTEQLLAFCELRPYRGTFFKHESLIFSMQADAPVLFVGHCYSSRYRPRVCTPPEKLFLSDELYQAFLTLQRLPPTAKNRAREKDGRPATYELDGTEFLAWLKSEVLLRKLQALLA